MYTVIMLWYSTRLFSKLICTQSVMVGFSLVRREIPIYGASAQHPQHRAGFFENLPTLSLLRDFEVLQSFSPKPKSLTPKICQMPDHCVLDHIVSLEISSSPFLLKTFSKFTLRLLLDFCDTALFHFPL